MQDVERRRWMWRSREAADVSWGRHFSDMMFRGFCLVMKTRWILYVNKNTEFSVHDPMLLVRNAATTPHPPHTLTPCPLHRQRGSPWVIVVNELASLLTRCLNRAVGLSPPPLSALSPPSWTFLELRRRVKRGQHPLLHWPWERLSSHSFWLPCTWWIADRDSTESRKNYRTIISKGVYTDKRREVQLIWTGFPRNKEEPRGRLTGRFYVSH